MLDLIKHIATEPLPESKTRSKKPKQQSEVSILKLIMRFFTHDGLLSKYMLSSRLRFEASSRPLLVIVGLQVFPRSILVIDYDSMCLQRLPTRELSSMRVILGQRT